MSFAIAGLISSGKIVINDCNNVGTSFPNFIELVSSCGLDIQAKEKSNG
jgi:3-phosphoshikimate 1-carboxyvinyltransferase